MQKGGEDERRSDCRGSESRDHAVEPVADREGLDIGSHEQDQPEVDQGIQSQAEDVRERRRCWHAACSCAQRRDDVTGGPRQEAASEDGGHMPAVGVEKAAGETKGAGRELQSVVGPVAEGRQPPAIGVGEERHDIAQEEGAEEPVDDDRVPRHGASLAAARRRPACLQARSTGLSTPYVVYRRRHSVLKQVF